MFVQCEANFSGDRKRKPGLILDKLFILKLICLCDIQINDKSVIFSKVSNLKRIFVMKFNFLVKKNQLSLAKFSFWSGIFVLYESYFSCDLMRIHYRKMNFLFQPKFEAEFLVFWENEIGVKIHIWKIEREYLTKEIGKRTLIIYDYGRFIPPS